MTPVRKKLNTPEKKRFAKRRLNTITKAKIRLAFTNKGLKEEIRMYQEKLEKLTEERIEEYTQRLNIGSAQAMVMREIINIAKYNSKFSRRYSADWLLMCLLMSIRSPEMYEFILRNDILPLPTKRTIRRRMSSINIECGFDASFFYALKKKLTTKTMEQKHVVLVFDEMSVRKGMKTDVTSMKYQGVVNFGDVESKSTDHDTGESELADHALVFGISSLGENYLQPIGCFASRGPTRGTTLAKLIIQAILLLEKAGGRVSAIVCDGARTNRKMWKEFGISGKLGSTRSFFTNPFDSDQKIYALSDVPHLFKCIRNRLLKNDLMVC